MNLTRIITALLLSVTLIASAQENQPAAAGALSGKVSETMDAGGYTYVKIMLNNQPVWAAGPVTPVKQGDQVSFSSGMPMNNFYSKTLKRDFKKLYFVDSILVNGKHAKAPASAATTSKGGGVNQSQISLKSFAKAENGQNVAEILNNKKALEGKVLRIRGQVSKFTPEVMGKNWIHIRDNSSQEDLTITTDATVALDDIILVEGSLVLDKDFGYGYVYDVIIEDAKAKVE